MSISGPSHFLPYKWTHKLRRRTKLPDEFALLQNPYLHIFAKRILPVGSTFATLKKMKPEIEDGLTEGRFTAEIRAALLVVGQRRGEDMTRLFIIVVQ